MAALAVLLTGTVTTPAEAQDVRDGIRVFAIRGAEPTRIDPIVVVTEAGWRQPILRWTEDEQAGWTAWYAARRTLYLLAGNVRGSVATAVPATSELSCFDVAGRLEWGADGAPPPVSPSVAVTDSSFGGAPLARPPSEDERATLVGAARALALGQGVEETLAGRLVPAGNVLTVSMPDGQPRVVLGGFTARGGGTGDRGVGPDRLVAVFVMVGAGPDAGDVRLERFNDGRGDGVRYWELVDVMDLTRDGTPELIVRAMGYEGWGYEILDEVDGGWEVTYTGGGGGC